MIMVCYRWAYANVPWNQGNWKWSECSGSYIPPEPVELFQPPGVDATTLIQPWLIEPWNPYRTGSLDKKKRLVRLICNVKGERYEEEKEMKNFDVSIDDIMFIINKTKNIDFNMKLEE